MQASTTPPGAGGGHATRRGHATHLSISDPSHHVTEAIGHMYDDDYDRNDSRRLSYISSPHAESITTVPRSPAASDSLHPFQPEPPIDGQHTQKNGHLRPPLATNRSFDRESDAGSDTARSPSETATSSFPLNDIDYESDPAAVVQELNNLAAIRRMSMDVAAAGDPDLPSFGSNLSIPSLPPSPSADENDASRLFWVPASLHPELAPKEFKSFLESKADLIKRKSGDFSSLGPERQGSQSSLRRKRSMLSKQIDDSSGYTDGADRLERQRSQASRRDGMLSPNLHQLETLVDESSSASNKDNLVKGMQNASIAASEDKPILPPAPLGHSLRRSTRTQYRKGSLKKGEKPPYSKRIGRGLSESAESAPTILSTDGKSMSGMTNVSDPASSTRTTRTGSTSSRSTAYTSGTSTGSTFNPITDKPQVEQDSLSLGVQRDTSANQQDAEALANAATYARQWQSRTGPNDRSTANTPTAADQTGPTVIESTPNDSHRGSPSSNSQPSRSDRDTNPSYTPKTTSSDTAPSKRSLMSPSRQGRETTPTLNDFANTPQMIPGNSTRTDSLSFIPTIPEEHADDRKHEGKKSKKEEGRKSSWHWLLGSEEKEKKKDKDSDSRRTKSKIAEKVYSSNARAEVPAQSSLDTTPKGRESLILDRLDPKLEEERRKDSARRASGDKKEKDGIFSSIFGGGRKKHGGEGHHRKNSSRNFSPDPPVRELRADVDYPWTRFSILEERAIYRMAHIKLANPRRALYSQVLLSNFMYSYLEKVQQMHPQMMVASSGSQRSSRSREREQQPDEYLQYQRYQEAQEQQQQLQHQQQYGDGAYDDGSMYDYDDDPHDRYQSHGHGKHGYENGHAYNSAHYQYGHSSFGDDVQLDDDDDDDMW